MHALKGLVVGLGMLIVISFGLLVYGFYTKLFNIEEDAPEALAGAAVPAPEAPIAGFGEVLVTLPGTCVVEEMRPDGAGRLYLRLGGDDGCQRILVVDVASGRQLGTLTLRR